MSDVSINVHEKDAFDRFARASMRATVNTANRMGAFVLETAKKNAPKFEHSLEHSGKQDEAVYDTHNHVATTRISFDAGHALYVEMGFAGHFVPFHIADSLYRQAIIQWGWRVPSPDQLKGLKPGRRYLIPPGGKRPRWGVFVRGDAQPFLRPAVEELKASQLPETIAAEEFQKAYREQSR